MFCSYIQFFKSDKLINTLENLFFVNLEPLVLEYKKLQSEKLLFIISPDLKSKLINLHPLKVEFEIFVKKSSEL